MLGCGRGGGCPVCWRGPLPREKQWWSLCDRECSPPGTKHSRELTQAFQLPAPPQLITSPSVSPCLQFLHVSVFCSPVCLFLSVFSLQRQLFSPDVGGRAEKCKDCADLLQLGLFCCLSLTEGSLFSITPVGDGVAAMAGRD